MTRTSISSRLAIALALLLILLAACGGTEVEPTPTPTPVLTTSGGQGGDQGGSGNEGDSPGADDDGPDSVGEMGPLTESANCLVGTWAVDHESFAGYMQDAFDSNAGDSGIEINFLTGSGNLFTTFTADGSNTVSGQDFQVDVEIPALSAQYTFFVNADGSASYAADDQAIATWDFQYSSEVEGEGGLSGFDSQEATAVLNVTPDQLWGYSSADGYTFPIASASADSSTSPYWCEGDSLIVGPRDYQPVLWNRVN